MSKQIDKTESLEAIDFQRHLLQSTLAFVYMTQFPRKPSVELRHGHFIPVFHLLLNLP